MAEEKFIHIVDDDYLSGDRYNFILNKKIIDKKSGAESYRPYAYYGRIEHVFKGLVNHNLAGNVELLNNIQTITKKMEEISQRLEFAVKELRDTKKEYTKGDPFEDLDIDEEETEEEDDI